MAFKYVTPPERPKGNFLLYGPVKTGKSAGAGTAPGGVLYLNTDVGNATRFVHRSNPNGRIMELELPAYAEGEMHLYRLTNEVLAEVSKPDQTIVESVVVDPVGELHRRLLEESSRRAVRPTQNQYGDVAAVVERFCRGLCEIPTINVVLVCHELLVQDETTGEVMHMPFTGTKSGSPALGTKLMSMVDVVGYTGVVVDEGGNRRYRAQLYPGRGRQGGDRFNCLGGARDLNISEWMAAIEADERGDAKDESIPLKLQSPDEPPNSTGNGEGGTTPEAPKPARRRTQRSKT